MAMPKPVVDFLSVILRVCLPEVDELDEIVASGAWPLVLFYKFKMKKKLGFGIF
jgi:hypothetical protein